VGEDHDDLKHLLIQATKSPKNSDGVHPGAIYTFVLINLLNYLFKDTLMTITPDVPIYFLAIIP